MDDELVQRWRDGDATAATAVRNSIRSWAERVLGHPALLSTLGPGTRARFANEANRREDTARIAVDVMRRDIPSANQAKAMTLMAAGREAVDALQDGRPAHPEGGRHAPPPIVVAMVLYPDGVNPRIREAIDKHFEECPACREDVRVMDRIIRNLDAVDHEVTRTDLAEAAALADRALANTVDLEQVMREAAQREKEDRAARQSRRPSPKPGPGGRTIPGRDPEPVSSPIRIALPLIAALLVAGGIWWVMRGDDPVSGQRVDGVRVLADVSPPDVGRLSDFPSETQLVVADFGRGDCRTAAGRLEGIQRTAPTDLRLVVLQGAALVCAKDGRRALKVFDDLETRVANEGGEARQRHWYRAQAHLLQGEATEAIAALQRAEAEDPRHRSQASALVERVSLATGG